MNLNVTRSRRWRLHETASWRVDGVMTRRWRHGGYVLRHNADVGRGGRARLSRHRRDAERGDHTAATPFFHAGAPRESTTTAGRLRRVISQALRRLVLFLAPT